MFDCGQIDLVMMLSPARGYMFNHCNIHDYKHKSLSVNIHTLLYTEIPYYGKESLTIEGNPSLPYYIKQVLYYIMKSLAIEGNALL